MAAVRAFAKKKGPRPCYDLIELRACAREGRLPPGAEGGAAGSAVVSAADAKEGAGQQGGGTVEAAASSGAGIPSQGDAGALSTSAGCVEGAAVAVAVAQQQLQGHSHYGCHTLLQLYLQRPELLYPLPAADQPASGVSC